MKIINESLRDKRDGRLFPEEFFGSLSYAVLDIETLGLSPVKAPIILCGVVLPKESRIIQLFAERADRGEEKEMLDALEDITASCQVYVTYNGRSFDVPYIEKRRQIIGLEPMAPRYDLDLFRVIKDHSDIGKFLPNLKQKTLEDFAGLWQDRSDEISGKDSIDLYHQYQLDRSKELERLILLHNRDDIAQLYRLTDLLKKANMEKALFCGGFPVMTKAGALIVGSCDLSTRALNASGIRAESGRAYRHFGDERPSYDFGERSFEITVPVINRAELLIADIAGLGLDMIPGYAYEDYIVLKYKDEIRYGACSALIKALCEKIAEKSLV